MVLNTGRNIRMFLIAITALGLCGSARGQTTNGCLGATGLPVPCVVLGSDYFATQPGAYFYLNGTQVPLTGDPIGPGSTDTIVQRQANATINGSSIPIQITALSLQGTYNATPIFVTLNSNPADLASDTGTMTIDGTTAGGMFTSTLDVNFDVCLAPGASGVGCRNNATPVATGSIAFGPDVNPWSSTPPNSSYCLVTGPVGDQAADCHTGLSSNEFDFFPGVTGNVLDSQPVMTCAAPTACHPVDPATPEPSSLVLMSTALLGIGIVAKKFFAAA